MHGIIEKEIFKELPPHSEYSLTEAGKALLSLIAELEKWGAGYLPTLKIVLELLCYTNIIFFLHNLKSNRLLLRMKQIHNDFILLGNFPHKNIYTTLHLLSNTPPNISISLLEILNRVANSRHFLTASITSETIFYAVSRLSI